MLSVAYKRIFSAHRVRPDLKNCRLSGYQRRWRSEQPRHSVRRRVGLRWPLHRRLARLCHALSQPSARQRNHMVIIYNLLLVIETTQLSNIPFRHHNSTLDCWQIKLSLWVANIVVKKMFHNQKCNESGVTHFYNDNKIIIRSLVIFKVQQLFWIL